MTNKENPTNEGTYEVGYKKPPKHSQFGQPGGNARKPGNWKREDTPRYKLEQMMKLTSEELQKIAEDKKSPLFERKLATMINSGDWSVYAGMITQVYGKPKEEVDHTIKGALGIEVSKSEKEILDIISSK